LIIVVWFQGCRNMVDDKEGQDLFIFFTNKTARKIWRLHIIFGGRDHKVMEQGLLFGKQLWRVYLYGRSRYGAFILAAEQALCKPLVED
jgi:hypothetical protein